MVRRLNIREMTYALGLLISSLLVSAGLAEIGFRLYLPQIFEVHPNGLWQLDPVLGCRLTPEFDGDHRYLDFLVRLTISKQGLRDREYGPKLPEAYRILALGDSFTFGFGVEHREAFPKQLESLLRSNHDRPLYEVINAGIPGYGTSQERVYFRKEGLNFQPDLVLVGFFAANDFKDNLLPPDRFTIVNGYMYDKQGYEKAVRDRDQRSGGLPIPFKDRLWAHSHMYRFLADRYHRLLLSRFSRNKAQDTPPGTPESSLPEVSEQVRGVREQPRAVLMVDREIFDITTQFLQDIAETAQQHGVGIALVLIPDIKLVNNPKDMWLPTWDALKSFASEYDIPVIDLAPAFWNADKAGQTEMLWYMQNKHWKAAGHRLAARLIYEELHRQQLIPLSGN